MIWPFGELWGHVRICFRCKLTRSWTLYQCRTCGSMNCEHLCTAHSFAMATCGRCVIKGYLS